jgi:DNA-binding MarR family transcriptional regulator
MRQSGKAAAQRPDPRVGLGPDLDFLRELWALDHALQKHSKTMGRTLGITGPQRLALRIVGRVPGLPLGQLARLLSLHPSTVTGIVRRLSERGLIARRADGADQRRSLAQITPSGLALLGRPEPTVESIVKAALRGPSEREIRAAVKVLAAVTAAFERRREAELANKRRTRRPTRS